MKIVRFVYKKDVCWGILEDKGLKVLKEAPYRSLKVLPREIPLKAVRFLPPATPSKIILVGLNYKEHARELGMSVPDEPVVFLKAPTALIGHEALVVYPKSVKRLDYEAELALVIGKKAKDIQVRDAAEYILGYTCLNDITARDIQKKDGQWMRAKSFDTFCPLGPYLETELNTSSLKIQLYLNGLLKQDSSTADFVFDPFHIVSFISKAMTLLPGDIVSTGTPSGVGPMERGDRLEVLIEGLGILKNKVV